MHKTEKGFGVLEVSIILSLLAALAVVLVVKSQQQDKQALQEQRALLHVADKQLINFVGFYGRLPCPDTTGDGVEDCGGASKGELPYITLGLTLKGYRSGDAPFKYGVYRNASTTTVASSQLLNDDASVTELIYSADADLAASTNRYEPAAANTKLYYSNSRNTLDFCVGLQNADTQADSTSRLYIQNGASNYNVAYALAAPGRHDADGSNGIYDGLNGQSANVGFEAASRQHQPSTYDDRVLSRGFAELRELMQCDVTINSLNLMANAYMVQQEVIDQAASARDDTVKAAILSGVNVAINIGNSAIAGVDLANAIAAMSAASAALSGAVASCAVLVGCALIPVYSAAVAAAGTGIALSGVALGASVAAVVAQGVATGMYIAVAIRAGAAADSVTETDWDAKIAEQQALKTDLENERDQAEDKRDASLAEYQAAEQYINADPGGALANIDAYITANQGPSGAGNPNQIPSDIPALVQTMYSAFEDFHTKKGIYDQINGEYQNLQRECNDCNNAVDTVLLSEYQEVNGNYELVPVLDGDGNTSVDPAACPVGSGGQYQQCLDAIAKNSELSTALTNLNTSKSALYTARNNAMQAAADFQVHSQDPISGDDVYTPCSAAPGCFSDLGQWIDNTASGFGNYSASGDLLEPEGTVDGDGNVTITREGHYYLDYLVKKDTYDSNESSYQSSVQAVSEIDTAIAGLQCAKDGKDYIDRNFDATPGPGEPGHVYDFACVDPSENNNPQAAVYAQDAGGILSSADWQGVSE
ncbi:hypothetical protein [Neptuniibacter sp.]|uniref:hypothetical protein n=1 Tax=Neptuniibacter sp. TaxID=1962643 RepID=UPI002635500D|nr:hypothetical protein [Neptuniibacter sp.]MCP4595117.1 hypothetical protein [Neptuniibacter sp.]